MPSKKVKEMKKKVLEYEIPVQKMFSIPSIPKDKDGFVKDIAKKLTKKTVPMQNFQFSIVEVGTSEGLTANFQLVGLIKASLSFSVKFEIGASAVDVFFGQKLTVEEAMQKAVLLFSANSYQAQILPILTKISTKVITAKKKEHKKEKEKKLKEEKEKKPKEEKEKKPKEEKEKKPKEEKEKKPKDPLKLLKLKFVEGEITEEEYIRKKSILKD